MRGHAAWARLTGGVLAAGAAVAVALAVGGGSGERALASSYPPFVLVGGLLLIGLVAGREGVFERAAARLVGLPIGPIGLLACCYLLVGVVTAALNLDTSVVFLTPIMIGVARRRGLDRAAFVYGSVFMANASSLVLVGSNLTNLLVLSSVHRAGLTGTGFFAHMAVMAFTAPVVTGLGLIVIHRRRLLAPDDGRRDSSGSSTATSERSAGGPKGPSGDGLWRGTGFWGMVAGAVLMISVAEPAIPVAAVGIVAVLGAALRRRVTVGDALARLGAPTLALLFGISVVLGTVARASSFPGDQVSSLGPAATAAVGAGASILINNLPAASLLGARSSPHVGALLVGLNLGPNLAVTGSLSALLWWRACRSCGVRPSAAGYSRQGIILAPLAILAALGIGAII